MNLRPSIAIALPSSRRDRGLTCMAAGTKPPECTKPPHYLKAPHYLKGPGRFSN